jgi:hypothetical protein
MLQYTSRLLLPHIREQGCDAASLGKEGRGFVVQEQCITAVLNALSVIVAAL